MTDLFIQLPDIRPVIRLPELFVSGKKEEKKGSDSTGVKCETWLEDFSTLQVRGGRFTLQWGESC